MEASMERVWVTLEIGKVMESVLDELTTWEWANKILDLENRLHHSQAMVLALRKNEEQLIEVNTRHRARALEEGSKAKTIQTIMCKDLWELAKKMDGQKKTMDDMRNQLCKKDLRKEQLESEVEKLKGEFDMLMMSDMKVAGVQTDEYGTPVSSPIIHQSSSSVQQENTTPAMKMIEASGSSTGLMEDAEKATLLALSCSSLQTIFSYLNSRDVIRTAMTHPIIFGKTNKCLGSGKELQQKYFSNVENRVPPRDGEGFQQLKERDGGGGVRPPIMKLINSMFPKRGSEETQQSGGLMSGIMGSTFVPSSSRGSGHFHPPSFSINSEVVNTLSTKLTFNEMRTIINIAAHSKALEDENVRLSAQKEDLEDKFENANSVKVALAKQLLDTEAKLKQTQNECEHITQQSANDAEVISFLDQREQEMEQVAKDSVAEASNARAELHESCKEHEKRVAVLEDMLRFERLRADETETSGKQRERILVAEVRKLRLQIFALQGEATEAKKELKKIRKCLMSA